MRTEKDPMRSRVVNGTRARRPAPRDGAEASPMGLRGNRNTEASPTTRRRFLKGVTAALAAPCFVPSSALAAPGRPGANDRIGVGLIGCGSLGAGHHLPANFRIPDVRITAVCDVDQDRREQAASKTEQAYKGKYRPGTYGDYRKLLERKDVDGVIVVTPDHWHALMTVHACQAGKDVHCEKPLTLTIEEGRAMVDAARRYARIVQTGSESRSNPHVRHICERVRSGRIGKLHTVRTGLGANPTTKWEPARPKPANLDWNQWLGPAPWVPFHQKRCFYTFRWFWDYSGGQLTDIGAHHNDVAQWGIGTDDSGPVHIEGKARYAKDNMYECPPWFEVTYTYANGVRLIASSDYREPVTFHGSEGKIGYNGSDPPEIAAEPLGEGDVHLYESNNHDRNWLECIRTRRLPVADVEIGHRSCTVCHLGNISIWLGRPVQWDPKRERFVNDPDADRMISRAMREPWQT